MGLLIVYVLFLLAMVLRLFRRPTRGSSDYILVGRRLTLPAFVATLVTTWYGGILGVGEYGWHYGISNWLVFGAPYYVYAAVFALFLAGRARRSLAITIPDQLERSYGRPAAITGAVVLFIMSAPAAYVLMLGVLVQWATGWPLWSGVVLGTALSIGYVFRGGLRAIVATDVVQFCLMFLAFLVLVPACVSRFGGWSFLRASVPATHWAWDGGLGAQAVIVWYFIAMQTLVDPAFYQRCYAARNERTARLGIGLSIICWIFFDLLTTTAALYARAVLPDLADPVAAFPRLAEQALAPFWQGVFFIGLLATVMSTIDSYAFISGVTIGRDIISRWRGAADALDGPAALKAIRWSLLVTAVFSILLAIGSGSVIQIWKILGSLGIPVLLLPLVVSHTRLQLSGRAVLPAMIGGGATSLVWIVLGRGGPFLGVEAIFPGLGISALVCSLMAMRLRFRGSG
jgi:SSS family solute:Na+ symporter